MAARSLGKPSLVLVFLIVGATPTLVKAQGNTFNPYGNSGYADYREFSTPMYSNNPALPGQTRLNGEPLITRPRANSYRQFLEEDEGSSETGRKGGSINNPNSRAYRPNDTPQNRDYAEHLKQREEAFANALKEKDPVKRAKLLRQIENDSASRMAAASKAKTAAGKAPDPNGLAKGTTSSKAPSPNGEKRSTAPPPLGSNGNRSTNSSSAPPISGTSTSRPRSSNSTATAPTTTAPKPGPPDPNTIAAPPR